MSKKKQKFEEGRGVFEGNLEAARKSDICHFERCVLQTSHNFR